MMGWCSSAVPALQGFGGTWQLVQHSCGDTRPPLLSLSRSDAALQDGEPSAARPLPSASREGYAWATVCLLSQPPR